jgi:serine/threonine-protein kinase
MATVHFGMRAGEVSPASPNKVLAIKQLLPQYARSPEFVAMFLDEAHLLARLDHPNIVRLLDVVVEGSELLLVMPYVPGESLARVARTVRERRLQMPLAIVSAILCGVLEGLEAAHEATDAQGRALGIVHRDVSPQNVIVGTDGSAHLIDFGVAKAAGRLQLTRDGDVKGKAAYMSPAQTSARPVDRRSDVFSAGILLWELLTGERLFAADNPISSMAKVVELAVPAPSTVSGAPPALDGLVMKALSRRPEDRFDTALRMARALREIVPPASTGEVAAWLEKEFGEDITAPRGRTVGAFSAENGAAATRGGRRLKGLQWPTIAVAGAAGAALTALVFL